MIVICTNCGQEKKLYNTSQNLCRSCYDKKHYNSIKNKEQCQHYYKQNKEHILAINKIWRDKNKEKCSESARLWIQNNRERDREIQRRYHLCHIDKEKEYNKKYYQKNKEKVRERIKIWTEKNKDKIRLYTQQNRSKLSEYFSKYDKNRLLTDIEYKIRKGLSRRINMAVRNQNSIKAYKTMDLVGCSIQQLREHLEKQFTEGMSWNNYGKWEIHHIIACTYFILTELEQQKLCFNYTNLKPLWLKEHREIGWRIEEEDFILNETT